MSKYQPRHRKILSSKLTIFGLATILALISWAVFNTLTKQETVNQQTAKLELEIQELEQQNIDLDNLIDYFASNEYIEKEAREKLNLAKPGEKVIMIPEEGVGNVLGVANLNKDGSKSSPTKWLNYFFGK